MARAFSRPWIRVHEDKFSAASRMIAPAGSGGFSMTIGKKLYLRFGAILAIMIVLFVMNIFTVRRQFAARSAVASTLLRRAD